MPANRNLADLRDAPAVLLASGFRNEFGTVTPLPRINAPIRCPKCGGVPVERETRFGTRMSCCDLWSWGGKPLVDGATHEARRMAHAAIDPLWEGPVEWGRPRVPRNLVYTELSRRLRIPRDLCHVGFMDRDMALSAVAAAEEIRRLILGTRR